MRGARILAAAALLLGACASNDRKIESTWQQIEQLEDSVLARWDKISLDPATRQALSMPDRNPVARVAWITVLAGAAYVQGDLPTLEHARDLLADCDAEVAALAK